MSWVTIARLNSLQFASALGMVKTTRAQISDCSIPDIETLPWETPAPVGTAGCRGSYYRQCRLGSRQCSSSVEQTCPPNSNTNQPTNQPAHAGTWLSAWFATVPGHLRAVMARSQVSPPSFPSQLHRTCTANMSICSGKRDGNLVFPVLQLLALLGHKTLCTGRLSGAARQHIVVAASVQASVQKGELRLKHIRSFHLNTSGLV